MLQKVRTKAGTQGRLTRPQAVVDRAPRSRIMQGMRQRGGEGRPESGGGDLFRYCRLLALYRTVKDRESVGCSWCPNLKAVLRIAADYGQDHKLGTTLEGAAPACPPS